MSNANKFFNQVKQQIYSGRALMRDINLIQDTDTYEDSEDKEPDYSNADFVELKYDDLNSGRTYENPKRQTARKAPSEKRSFGYQLPIDFSERPLTKSTDHEIELTSNNPLEVKKPTLFFDIVKK